MAAERKTLTQLSVPICLETFFYMLSGMVDTLMLKLLIVDVFLEVGRVTNLVYGQALKTSGDALFPVILGAIFMYLFAVGGTYFLGIHMGLLAVGSYIAMAGDECARAVGMVLRWKSGKWKSKNDIQTYKEIVAFTEGKKLDELHKAVEVGKRPYQNILKVIIIAGATAMICFLIGVLMHLFLN